MTCQDLAICYYQLQMLKTLMITSVVVLALIGAGITLKDFPKPSLKEPNKETIKDVQKE